MSVNKATVGAISFSGVTLIVCLYAIAVIYNDVQAIWAELDNEMDSFKVLTDDLWRDMVGMGAGTPSNRIRRQAYGGYGASSGPGFPTGGSSGGSNPPLPGSSPPHFGGSPSGHNSRCNCQSGAQENKCPPGPDGPMGEAGPTGLDGLPGQAGKDGKSAEDIHQSPPSGKFHCPMGPPGVAGPAGRPGARGMRGRKGAPGFPGTDGFPGSPGEIGPPGAPGDSGKPGATGEKGDDVEKPVPRKGYRGESGQVGDQGPQGDQGAAGAMGKPGPKGPAGPAGFQGPAGSNGDDGPEGVKGAPGRDAQYCPCPDRHGGGGGRHSGRGGGSSSGVNAHAGGADGYRARRI